jgi:hypothetical protein
VATFLNDTFTENGDVILSSHTPDTGGAWAIVAFDADTATVNAAGDYVTGDGSSSAWYFNSASPANNEYDVTAIVRVTDNTQGAVGVLGRYTDDASNPTYYRAGIAADGNLYLMKRLSGAGEVSLGSYALNPVNNTDYTIKLEIRTATKKVYVDTVERISDGNDEITATGKAAVQINSFARMTSVQGADAGSVQLLAPIQDISAGTWLPSAGSPADLYAMIDGEKSPDDDYDYTSSAGTMEVKFASGSTPSLQTGHTLRYRLRGNGTCDALVKLKQGTTVLAQWTETNVPAVDTDYSHTLDSSPSFTITDYTDLRISVEAAP